MKPGLRSAAHALTIRQRMLKLCGFRISNYHNKVRLALLEKGVPFEEDAGCSPSQKDEFLARIADRQGAVPRARRRPAPVRVRGDLRVPRGSVSAEAAPAAATRSSAPRCASWSPSWSCTWSSSRGGSTATVFFKRQISEETKQAAEKDLAKGMRAFKTLVKFDPVHRRAASSRSPTARRSCTCRSSRSPTKHAFGRDVLDEMPQLEALPQDARRAPGVQPGQR